MALELTADRANAESARIAGRLPPLLIAAERIAATVVQGVHGRRRVGSGDVFWQHRPYYPGDELRQLDWRQSAKSDKVYLRQMEWAAAQSVWPAQTKRRTSFERSLKEFSIYVRVRDGRASRQNRRPNFRRGSG